MGSPDGDRRDPETVRRAIREALRRTGTRAELADRIGASRNMPGRWERGKARPQDRYWEAILAITREPLPAQPPSRRVSYSRSIYQQLLDEVRAQRAEQRETAAAVVTIGEMISDRYPDAKSAPFAQWQTVIAMRALREALAELPPPEERADAR